MECERFKNLLKTWYIQVQDESLAPARMVTFMRQHIAECRVCLMDPGVRQEVEKLTEIILPPSKVRTPAPGPKEEEAISVPAAAAPEPEPEEEAGDEDEDLDEDEEEESDDEEENEDEI